MRFSATKFMDALGIECPIIQSPMAGGATTPQLVAAVSNAGGLGSFAAGMVPPEGMVEAVGRIRALTSRPFGVNVFIMEDITPSPAELDHANALLAPFRAELGLAAPAPLTSYCQDYRAQIDRLVELAPAVVSFTFGVLDRATVTRLRRAGCVVVGTATTVAEAVAWETAGADAVSAQGAEAGGHRGSFLKEFEMSNIGLFALVPQMVRAVSIPVIAAGGIMDGRGIAAALMLGAEAAQLGTAFLGCPESGISPPWKRGVLAARQDETRITRVFSGRPARGIVNDFMRRLDPREGEVPPYPLFNALTGDIRRAAAAQDRPEFLSLWAGQGVGLTRPLPAAGLMRVLRAELEEALGATPPGTSA